MYDITLFIEGKSREVVRVRVRVLLVPDALCERQSLIFMVS